MREQKGGRGLSDGIPSGSTAARTKEDNARLPYAGGGSQSILPTL